MAYVTPITDRTLADVVAKNSKGLFNVADWTRIYGNALYVNGEYNAEITWATVPFTTITAPTTSTNPSTIAPKINALLQNIVNMIVGIFNITGSYIYVISYRTYIAGAGNRAPNYQDINQWEAAIDAIHNWLAVENELYPRTGIAVTGLDIIYNNQWRP